MLNMYRPSAEYKLFNDVLPFNNAVNGVCIIIIRMKIYVWTNELSIKRAIRVLSDVLSLQLVLVDMADFN